MKKSLLLLLAMLPLIVACNKNVPVKETTDPSKALLFKISNEESDKVSYLFGTMHIIPKEHFFFPAGTMEALTESDAVVMETNIDIGIKDKVALAQKMILPDGKTIKDYASESDYEKFKAYCMDELGIKEKKFERYAKLKPILASAVFIQEYYGDVELYEKHFLNAAKKADKELKYLESLDFQFKVLDTIPIEKQLEGYFETDLVAEFDKMIEMYVNQDIKALYQYIQKEGEEIEGDLIINRNIDWIPKLEAMMAEQSLFIAVGAGHLGGEMGVIKLLKEKGYQVEPVM